MKPEEIISLIALAVSGVPADLNSSQCDYWSRHSIKLQASIARILRNPENILKPFKVVELPDWDKEFTFQVGEHDGISISFLSKHFKEKWGFFSSLSGHQYSSSIQVHEVLEDIVSEDVFFDELTGYDWAILGRVKIRLLLLKQGHGEEGPLHVNGEDNIFYLSHGPDKYHLHTTVCRWDASRGGWAIIVKEGLNTTIKKGSRVFSRKYDPEIIFI